MRVHLLRETFAEYKEKSHDVSIRSHGSVEILLSDLPDREIAVLPRLRALANEEILVGEIQAENGRENANIKQYEKAGLHCSHGRK